MGQYRNRARATSRLQGMLLGVMPTPLQKMLHAFPHTMSCGLDGAASTGNIPVTTLGVEVPA